MKRRTFIGAAAGMTAAAATGLSAPALGQGAAARTLRFVPQANLANFDPIWGTQYVVRNGSALVWDTLYGVDSKLERKRQMVEGEEHDAEFKVWTFRLRPGLKFHDGEAVLRNAGRLVEAAALLGVPCLFTEQNPKGLGPTVEALPVDPDRLVRKQSFGACREDGFLERIPPDRHVVVIGCEAHVCVLQTVLGLLAAARATYVASDAVGSRTAENRRAAIRRMERHGAEIVTTEMVVFEWLKTAQHPQFRQAIALIK